MSWDEVEVDFGGEETANFGPRQESGTALFQVDTLATISPRGEVISNPAIHAACGTQGFCAVADYQVSLFDETCHNLDITLSFDSEVDVVAWSDDSMFVVVAERRGVINFVDVQIKTTLFSQSLISRDEKDRSKCFQQMCFVPGRILGTCELVVLASDGTLFRFSNINLVKLNQAIEAQDMKLAKQLQEAITLEQTDTSYLHTEGANFFTTAQWEGMTHIVTCGKGSSVLAIWKCDKNSTRLVRMLGNELFGGVGVVQCRVSTNGKWLFLLDEEHTLSVFDPRTLIMLGYWPNIEIQQFILMNYNSVNTGNKNSGTQPELQLVVLTPGPEYFLKVFTLPGMQCTYSLAVSKYCTLAEVLPSQEPIFLLEGSYEEYLSDVISVLRVRCLTEALPETRFNRLLHKKKFEEAERFARQFELDVELVYKVKTGDLLEKASPWNNYPPEEGQSLCDELKACLEQITDITFVVDSCVQAALPTSETMYDILRYAKQRLQKEESASATNQGNTLAQLATKVMNVTHRLETFQMVYSGNAYSASQWDIFLRADMLEELLKRLILGHLTEADIIWKRHKPEYQGDITEDILQQLLTAIPENMHSSKLVILLQQDIIPFVVHSFPKGKRPLAKWIEEKAKNMEISEKADWPKNSLKFAELFFTTNQDTRLSPEQYTTELTSKTTCTAGASDLWELVQKLRALLHLRTKYNCRMPLAEYDRETTSSIVFRMLDRVVAPELIPSAIENILRPYMKEHNLSEDKLLLQYIEDLLEHSGKQAVYTYEASWEAKAIAVINCMKDLEYHIMGIFTIMSCAKMPWSRALENIIHDGLALNHPRVSDLKERYNLLQLKKMLTKYELTQHNVLDKTTAQTVMQYIISQDKPDSLQDALKVVVAYNHMSPADAYLFQVKFLIKKNRIEEAVNLLKTLPISEAKVYCKRIVLWAEVTLQSILSSMDQECIEETELITQAAVTMLNFLLGVTDGTDERLELEQLQMDLKYILALQTEYGEFLSIPRFRDETVRKSLLEQYLIKFYTNKVCKFGISEDKTTLGSERKSRNDENKKNFYKICRLGELLKFSPTELRGQLAITAAKTGEVQTALRMAKELSSDTINADVAKTLYTIVHTLCMLWAEENPKLLAAASGTDTSLMTDMLNLAHQAATHCSEDLLCDCLQLCKLVRLASSVYQQCESGAYGITVQTTSSSATKDPYSDWPFDDFFKEDTLVMDSSVVMPMVQQLTMTCLPLTQEIDGYLPLQQNHIGGREFVTTVQEEEREEDTELSVQDPPASHLEMTSSSAVELIQHLQENNQYEIALKVLLVSLGSCLQHFVANTMAMELCDTKQASQEQQLVMDIGKLCVERLKMFTSTILMKICGSRYVDCALGLGYTCILAKQTALDTLKSLTKGAGQNFRRLLAVATIGEAFAHLNNETQVLELCQKLITSAKWGKRLSRLKIVTNDVFATHDIQSKRQLLPEIVKKPNVDVGLIKEYCRAFNILEVNDALLAHLDMLLLSNNHHTDRPYVINMAAIQTVLLSISNQDLLVQRLSEGIEKVDSYDYERLTFIMKQIEQRRTEATQQNLHNVDLGLKLLSRLALYTRKFEPSQYELDFHCTTEEEQLRGIRGRLSPLAKTQLPYHPLLRGGQWKILRRELNEDTVSELLPICNLLRLPPDEVYVVTIQNVMNRYKDQKPTMHHPGGDSSSKTMVIDIKVLEKVQKLLLCISDPNMATATARMVAKELPLGPEKVMALKVCEMLARHAIDKCPENCVERQKAQLLHQKLSVVYRAVATEQILHKHHLASQTLLSIVETPARLIFMLYEHSSIQERKLGKQQDLPDIHAAANEIATVNNLDIQKIWLRLVDMWLPHPSATKQPDDDVTLNISLVSLDETSHTEEEKSLKRVIYVLQAGDIKTNAKFLLNYAFKVESSKITNACRVRALRCLFTLQDAEEIEQLALKPVKEIREYMKNLLYLCKLEHLNISMDLEAFIKVDKEGLVRGLWRNHSRNQKAVRLVADLCIDFKIHDSQLWNSILLQLIKFNMMDFLHHVLASLAAIPELWQIQCLPRAWRSVLLAPFTAVCAPLTQEQEDNCRQSAILLQSCPMAMSLDVMSLCKQFMKVEMFAEALGCLLYIPEPEKKQNQIQALLGCNCHIAILDEIAKVEKNEKQVPQAKKIRAAVFNHLSQTDNYSLLQGTKHFASMVNYFVKTKDITGLLKRALIAQRLNDAVDIVNMYTTLHPDTPSIQGTFGQQIPGITKLRSYLKTHRLEELLCYVPNEPRQYHSESS